MKTKWMFLIVGVVLYSMHNAAAEAENSSAIHSAAISPDNRYVVTTGPGNDARLWDANTCTVLRSFRGHQAPVRAVAFSPDGKLVLSGSEDETARLWKTEDGELKHIFRAKEPFPMRSVAFSPDGRLLGTGSDGVDVVEIADQVNKLRVDHNVKVHSIAFSPDSKIVLGADTDAVRLWDIASSNKIDQFGVPNTDILSAALSPDGRYVLTGSSDGVARLRELNTTNVVHKYQTSNDVRAVAFSSDGKFVLTGGGGPDDWTVRRWGTETEKVVESYVGHKSFVNSVVVSSDDRYVLTASSDGSAMLWEFAGAGVRCRFENK